MRPCGHFKAGAKNRLDKEPTLRPEQAGRGERENFVRRASLQGALKLSPQREGSYSWGLWRPTMLSEQGWLQGPVVEKAKGETGATRLPPPRAPAGPLLLP